MSTKHLLNLFADRLRALPIVVLYLTDGCNSRCLTCDIWRNPRRNMSPELVEAIAADLKPLAVRWLVLSGGEAMQHPRWAEIARRFRAEGVRVSLLTNGLLLRKQIDDVLSSVDDVIVSLDGGTPATYEAIRGVDALDLILDGIRLIRQGGLPVTTRTTVQRANFREIPQIIEAAKSVDVNAISFLTVDVSNPFAFGSRAGLMANFVPLEHQPPASALTLDDLPELAAVLDDVEFRFASDFATGRIAESPAKLRKMLGYFGAVLQQNEYPHVRCNAPHLSAIIEVDGTLRPCYFLPAMGKVNGTSLHDAINTPAALDLRRAYRSGERSECQSCVCPLYKDARALVRL